MCPVVPIENSLVTYCKKIVLFRLFRGAVAAVPVRVNRVVLFSRCTSSTLIADI